MLRTSLVLLLLVPFAAAQPSFVQAFATGVTADLVHFRIEYSGMNYGCGDIDFSDGSSRAICIRVSDGLRAHVLFYGPGITISGSGANTCPPTPGAGGATLGGRIDGAPAVGAVFLVHDCEKEIEIEEPELPEMPEMPEMPELPELPEPPSP